MNDSPRKRNHHDDRDVRTYGKSSHSRNSRDNSPDRRDYERFARRDRSSYLERRLRLRAKLTLDKESVWESSPSPPRITDEEIKKTSKLKKKEREKKKKGRKKKKRSPSPSDSSSESSSSSSTSSGESSSPGFHRKKNRKKNKKEYIWVEKTVQSEDQNDMEDVVGPIPLPSIETRGYGRDLLPGEGDAIARFVQQNKRIPRRGEIGITSEEIDKLEEQGFVMSGNRNKKMTAVRIRKENQVYTVEEKRALAQANMEEKAYRENQIIASFRELAQKTRNSPVEFEREGKESQDSPISQALIEKRKKKKRADSLI